VVRQVLRIAGTRHASMLDPASGLSLTRFILDSKIETTDYVDYADYERVMSFLAFIFWVSLRFDRSDSYFPRNPLQSVNRSEAEIGRLTQFQSCGQIRG